MRPGSGSGSEEARGGLADGVAEGGVHSEGKKMNEALGSGTGHVSRHQGGAEKMHEEARCHRYSRARGCALRRIVSVGPGWRLGHSVRPT